jgi:hypothetical protein
MIGACRLSGLSFLTITVGEKTVKNLQAAKPNRAENREGACRIDGL